MKIIKKWVFVVILSIAHSTCKTQVIMQASIPKCGTWMLHKLLYKLTGIENLVRVNGGALLEMSALENDNSILLCHAPYVETNVKILKEFPNIKKIFIYRDPRDMVCSMAHFIKEQYQPTWPNHSEHPFDVLLSEIITTGSIWSELYKLHFKDENNYIPLWEEMWSKVKSIDDLFRFYIPWIEHKDLKNVYVTTYEKMVGPKSGGTLKRQINEIMNIAKHIEVEITEEKAKVIADDMFGNTFLFRKGQIGSWKEDFKPKHVEQFKKIAGQLLIDLGYEKDFNWGVDIYSDADIHQDKLLKVFEVAQQILFARGCDINKFFVMIRSSQKAC